MCSKPLKYTSIGLEEGNKEIILPPRSTPTFGGPSNQTSKHYHKLKRCGIISLVCSIARKGIIRIVITGTLEGQATRIRTIYNIVD